MKILFITVLTNKIGNNSIAMEWYIVLNLILPFIWFILKSIKFDDIG